MEEDKKLTSQGDFEMPDFARDLPFHVKQDCFFDLCTSVVFARDQEIFLDFSDFVLPSVICRCICENVEVTRRSITFDCDHVALCVEYVLCLKFFPKVGDPFCQSFQGCFAKRIDFDEFRRFPGTGPITFEEFLAAEGACVEVEPLGCFCFAIPEVCETFVLNDVFFKVRVKLFQERNIVVFGQLFGGPVVKLPKVVNSCGLTGLQDDDDAACQARTDERLSKMPAKARERYQREKAAFMKQIEE